MSRTGCSPGLSGTPQELPKVGSSRRSFTIGVCFVLIRLHVLDHCWNVSDKGLMRTAGPSCNTGRKCLPKPSRCG